MKIRKVFISNRAEIACRIARTATRMNIKTCGVYTPQDRYSKHVHALNEIIQLPAGDLSANYLNQNLLIEIAKSIGADSVHPGYGFLSENPDFAEKVISSGLIWIGPKPDSMRKLGGKIEAKLIAETAGVPVAPWKRISGNPSKAEIKTALSEIGLPLLIKAAHGGGGRGQRIVSDPAGFEEGLRAARSESLRSFGSDEVFLERFLDRPRHIEAQIIGDSHGGLYVLGERDCTLQRRNQKVVEEAPAAILDNATRTRLHEWALKLGTAVHYRNAGTIEFIAQEKAAGEWEFYFMELNARLQVEHPVTEMIFGIDLVEMQFREANGENLSGFLTNLKPEGHAIELRLCAEDPAQQFLPTPGPITETIYPEDSHLRIESGFDSGSVIPQEYDSLFAKMILKGETRERCIVRLQEVLAHTIVAGTITNKYFLSEVLRHPDFINNEIDTRWIQHHPELIPDQTRLDQDLIYWAKKISSEIFVQRAAPPEFETAANPRTILLNFIADPLHGTYSGQGLVIFSGRFQIAGQEERKASGWISRFEICISFDSAIHGIGQRKIPFAGQFEVEDFKTHHGPILAQVPGVILDVRSKVNDIVQPQQPILIIEAMKIEMPVFLPVASRITGIGVKQGDRIQPGQTLITWEPYN